MSVSSVAERWVEEVAGLTQPARVVWCDGSKPEYDTLIEAMLAGRHAPVAQSPDVSQLVSAPQPPIGRRPHGAAHVHLHP